MYTCTVSSALQHPVNIIFNTFKVSLKAWDERDRLMKDDPECCWLLWCCCVEDRGWSDRRTMLWKLRLSAAGVSDTLSQMLELIQDTPQHRDNTILVTVTANTLLLSQLQQTLSPVTNIIIINILIIITVILLISVVIRMWRISCWNSFIQCFVVDAECWCPVVRILTVSSSHPHFCQIRSNLKITQPSINNCSLVQTATILIFFQNLWFPKWVSCDSCV